MTLDFSFFFDCGHFKLYYSSLALKLSELEAYKLSKPKIIFKKTFYKTCDNLGCETKRSTKRETSVVHKLVTYTVWERVYVTIFTNTSMYVEI